MNAVIAPFKEPLPCQDTIEWPFLWLQTSISGEPHWSKPWPSHFYCPTLLTFSLCHSSVFILSLVLIYFKRHLCYFSWEKHVFWGFAFSRFCFLLSSCCVLVESFWWRRAHSLSVQIFTIWLFFERGTVFNMIFWITNFLWKSFCDVQVHRTCSFNAQL